MEDHGVDKPLHPLCKAARILREKRTKEASRSFVALAFPIIEAGIFDALSQRHRRQRLPAGPGRSTEMLESSSLVAEEAFNSFLEKRLVSDSFLAQLEAAHTAPEAMLRRSAANHVRDQFRARSLDPLAVRVAPPADTCSDFDAEDLLPSADSDSEPGYLTSSAETLISEREELSDGRQAAIPELARLNAKELVLVKLVHASTWDLTPAELQTIAERRKLPIDQVRAQLDARAEWLEENRCAAEERIARRRHRVRLSERNLRVLVACMRDRGEPIEASKPTPVRPHAWTSRGLGKLSAEQRSGLLAVACQVLEERQRLLQEAVDGAKNGEISTRGWEDIALLLGEADANTPPARLKTVINTLTVRYKRARAKLMRSPPPGEAS